MKVVGTFSGWGVKQRNIQTFLLWRCPFGRIDGIQCSFLFLHSSLSAAHGSSLRLTWLMLPRVGLRRGRRMVQVKRQPLPDLPTSVAPMMVVCCALPASRRWSYTQPLIDLIGPTCKQGQAYFPSAGPK